MPEARSGSGPISSDVFRRGKVIRILKYIIEMKDQFLVCVARIPQASTWMHGSSTDLNVIHFSGRLTVLFPCSCTSSYTNIISPSGIVPILSFSSPSMTPGKNSGPTSLKRP